MLIENIQNPFPNAVPYDLCYIVQAGYIGGLISRKPGTKLAKLSGTHFIDMMVALTFYWWRWFLMGSYKFIYLIKTKTTKRYKSVAKLLNKAIKDKICTCYSGELIKNISGSR